MEENNSENNINPKYEELKETFDMFDLDKDGLINVNELGCAMRAQAMTPTDQDLEDMIKYADEDEDGKINIKEFLLLMNSKNKNTDVEKELTEAFKFFDKENIGKINVNEFRHIMSTLGEKLCDEEIDEMIKRGDPRNEGFIDYKEFINLIIEQ